MRGIQEGKEFRKRLEELFQPLEGPVHPQTAGWFLAIGREVPREAVDVGMAELDINKDAEFCMEKADFCRVFDTVAKAAGIFYAQGKDDPWEEGAFYGDAVLDRCAELKAPHALGTLDGYTAGDAKYFLEGFFGEEESKAREILSSMLGHPAVVQSVEGAWERYRERQARREAEACLPDRSKGAKGQGVALCLRDHKEGSYEFRRGDYYTAFLWKFAETPRSVPVILAGPLVGFEMKMWAIQKLSDWKFLKSTRPVEFLRAGFSPEEKTRNLTHIPF